MIICCSVLALISQHREESNYRKKFTKREHLFFAIIVCYMIVFAGLRTYFNDTHAYIVGFRNAAKFPEVLSRIDWTFGENPGFRLFTAAIKTFTSNDHIYLFLCSALTLYPTIWFLRKYTSNFALSVFLFFMLGYYSFAMAAIKQTIATAITLIAIDRLIHGKKILFILLVLLGMTFHPYCLLYFFAPILLKQVPWRKGTWILILITIAVAYSFNFLTGVLLDVTDLLGDSYDANAFVGEGINFFRVMVYFVPVVISFLWRQTFFEDSSEKENLFMNFTVICSLIMFVGLFGNANMFARLAIFFEPMIYISLPWMISKLRGSLSGMLISFGTYTAFPLYFYYQMVITSGFNQAFVSISFGQFIATLLN